MKRPTVGGVAVPPPDSTAGAAGTWWLGSNVAIAVLNKFR